MWYLSEMKSELGMSTINKETELGMKTKGE